MQLYNPDCDSQWLKGMWQDARYVEGLFPTDRYFRGKHERLVKRLNGGKSEFETKLDKLVAGAPVLVKWFN